MLTAEIKPVVTEFQYFENQHKSVPIVFLDLSIYTKSDETIKIFRFFNDFSYSSVRLLFETLMEVIEPVVAEKNELHKRIRSKVVQYRGILGLSRLR